MYRNKVIRLNSISGLCLEILDEPRKRDLRVPNDSETRRDLLAFLFCHCTYEGY